MREESLLHGITRAWGVFLAGNSIIAGVFTVAAYYLTRNAIIKHRLRKKRRRGSKRAAL